MSAEQTHMLLYAVRGVYFIVAFMVGSELCLDILRLNFPMTPFRRMAGIPLLIDAIGIFVGIFLYTIFPSLFWLKLFGRACDGLVILFMLLACATLLKGRYPSLKFSFGLSLPVLIVFGFAFTRRNSYEWASIALNCYYSVIAAYLAWRLWKHDQVLRDYHSSLENRNTKWYIGFFVFILCQLFVYYMCLVRRQGVDGLICINDLFMTSIYIMLARRSILQKETFIPEEEMFRQPTSQCETAMDEEQRNQLQTDLDALMNEHRLYTNANLSMDDLARELNTNTTYLYFFLRDILHVRFYDLVNGYRIRHAKDLMRETEFTIESISQECGFNSPHAFLRVFKRMENITPSEWRKQYCK